MSLTCNLYHIVFNTKRREMTINLSHATDLYRYLWRILEDRKCKLLRISGIPNHVHIFVDLHPTVCIADIAREMKRKSSLWMKKSGLFPDFAGWSEDYFAFSKSAADRDTVINYIKNQKEHHGVCGYEDEIRQLSYLSGKAWDERYLR